MDTVGSRVASAAFAGQKTLPQRKTTQHKNVFSKHPSPQRLHGETTEDDSNQTWAAQMSPEAEVKGKATNSTKHQQFFQRRL